MDKIINLSNWDLQELWNKIDQEERQNIYQQLSDIKDKMSLLFRVCHTWSRSHLTSLSYSEFEKGITYDLQQTCQNLNINFNIN